MKYSRMGMVSLALLGSLLAASPALAATLPIAGVTVIAKQMLGLRRIIVGQTDKNGAFTITGTQIGPYEIFINDESTPAVEMTSIGTKISGKVVIMIDEPEAKKPAPALPAAATKPAVKKPAPVVKTSKPKLITLPIAPKPALAP